MNLYNYATGEKIGTTTLTSIEWAAMSQQPEGIVRLGALTHAVYELDADEQGLHEDTTVYAE